MKSFIAFGAPSDVHIGRVVTRLRALNVNTHLVPSWPGETAPYPPMSWSTEAETSLPSDAVVWLRNKHRVGHLDDERKLFEWMSVTATAAFVQGAVTTGGAKIINASSAPAASDLKIAQLRLARDLGLDVPRTLVSNDKAAILSFVSDGGPCIVKPLYASGSPGVVGNPDSAMLFPTTRVSPEDVEAAPEASFRAAPNIFQEEIRKDHELRVIAAGDELISYRIDSQRLALTRTDWRVGEGLLRGVRQEPDAGLAADVAVYMRAAGLDLAVFDFAVTPDGRHVFFESNPAGQWAGMEDPIEQEVSDMVARQFARLSATLLSRVSSSTPTGRRPAVSPAEPGRLLGAD